jgi:hypothetical protein
MEGLKSSTLVKWDRLEALWRMGAQKMPEENGKEENIRPDQRRAKERGK